VEELWEPEDRQGPDWDEFEQLRDSFFQDDSLAFRSWVNLRCQAKHSEISWVDDATTVKPIHLAAAYGLTSIVTKLIERNVNLHAKTDEGYSPLQFAAEYYGSLEEPRTRSIELLELLLKNKADPNQKTGNFSALCVLIFQNPKVDAIKLFLKYKADATWKDRNWKRGILHYFVMCCNNIEALHALITAGADPNAKDLWGETPLHILMKEQDPSTEILEALIVAGADVNAEDSSSQRR
jgi:cytohesin